MDPPYNVHLIQNSVQCKPNTKIVHHSANRGSGVVFLIASGFLQQKTDVVMTKGATVNSLSINILCSELSNSCRLTPPPTPPNNKVSSPPAGVVSRQTCQCCVKILSQGEFKTEDVVAHHVSTPYFWDRGPGLNYSISYNDLDALNGVCGAFEQFCMPASHPCQVQKC